MIRYDETRQRFTVSPSVGAPPDDYETFHEALNAASVSVCEQAGEATDAMKLLAMALDSKEANCCDSTVAGALVRAAYDLDSRLYLLHEDLDALNVAIRTEPTNGPEPGIPDAVTAEEWQALGERLAKLPGRRMAATYAHALAEVEANDEQIRALVEDLRRKKDVLGHVDPFDIEFTSGRLRKLGADPVEVIPDELIEARDPRHVRESVLRAVRSEVTL